MLHHETHFPFYREETLKVLLVKETLPVPQKWQELQQRQFSFRRPALRILDKTQTLPNLPSRTPSNLTPTG